MNEKEFNAYIQDVLQTWGNYVARGIPALGYKKCSAEGRMMQYGSAPTTGNGLAQVPNYTPPGWHAVKKATRIIAELPSPTRTALEACYVLQQSPKQYAATTRRNARAIEKWYERARKVFKDAWREYSQEYGNRKIQDLTNVG